jgi:hypothetical protein
MNIDVVQMQQQIDNEMFTDALKQGVMGYMSAIPQMALQSQGQFDPVPELQKVAKLIELREKGKAVHDAVLSVFTPKEQPGQAAPQNPMEAALAASQGAGGPQPQGAPPGPPGAPQQAQGMDLMSLLSGLSSKGEATMSARTQRQSPI